MSEYVIETGVPIPPKQRGKGPGPKYPFHLLEVGQSVVLPRKAESAATKARRNGKRFTARRLPDGLVRVWRIA